MAKFVNPLDPENKIIREKIKEWFKEFSFVENHEIISIEEFPCWEPNCPDYFTKIIISQNETLKSFIIRKPLTFVRKIDVKSLNFNRLQQ